LYICAKINHMKRRFKIGEKVLISPEVTHQIDWIEGTIIEVEDNPFVGIVLVVQTCDGDVFFERESLFKVVNEKELCLL